MFPGLSASRSASVGGIRALKHSSVRSHRPEISPFYLAIVIQQFEFIKVMASRQIAIAPRRKKSLTPLEAREIKK